MRTLHEWLAEGPFTLALSSGFFGFFAHCGFVEALTEVGFAPVKITGASAGALVGAGLASGKNPGQLREIFAKVQRDDFWDPRLGLGYLQGRKFLNIMRTHFAPTFAQTEIQIEIAAFDVLRARTTFLKEGDLPEATYASCAVPLMFHPIWIKGRLYCDGGVLRKSAVPGRTKPGERILAAYLDSTGPFSAIENKLSLFDLKSRAQVVRLRGLPQPSPNALHLGAQAYLSALAQTREALKRPV